MSRHRNVRRMNYDEEYDGYDDVYGRSVEDERCISPSSAQFMYDRNSQQHEMAAFLPDDNIAEEELDDEDYKRAIQSSRKESKEYPSLTSLDEARLRSCLDAIHNVVGDSFSENILVDAIIKNKFDFEKSLDFVLSTASESEASKSQQKAPDMPKEDPPLSKDKITQAHQARKSGLPPDQKRNLQFSTSELMSIINRKVDDRNARKRDALVASLPVSTNSKPQTENFQKAVSLPNAKVLCDQDAMMPAVKMTQSSFSSASDLLINSSLAHKTVPLQNHRITPLVQTIENKPLFSFPSVNMARSMTSSLDKSISLRDDNITLTDDEEFPKEAKMTLDQLTSQHLNSQQRTSLFGTLDHQIFGHIQTDCATTNSDTVAPARAKECMNEIKMNLGQMASQHLSSQQGAGLFGVLYPKKYGHIQGEKTPSASNSSVLSNLKEISSRPKMDLAHLAIQHQNLQQETSLFGKVDQQNSGSTQVLNETRDSSLSMPTRVDECPTGPKMSLGQLAASHLVSQKETSLFGVLDPKMSGPFRDAGEAVVPKTLSVKVSAKFDDELSGPVLDLRDALRSHPIGMTSADVENINSDSQKKDTLLGNGLDKSSFGIALLEKRSPKYRKRNGMGNASPSFFVCVLCRQIPQIPLPVCCRDLPTMPLLIAPAEGSTGIHPFDFSTPSPDEIVRQAQAKAFGRKALPAGVRRPKPHATNVQKNVVNTDSRATANEMKFVTDSIAKMSFPSSKRAVTGFYPEPDKATPTKPGAESAVQNGNDKALADGAFEKSNNGLILEGTGQTTTPTIKSTPGRGRDPSTKLDPEAEYQKQRGSCKNLLNLVVIGHVDAGKSTLMGHLLCLVGAVSQKVMHKYEQESKKIGKASFMYAWVLDETGEERSRGVTMDVGYFKFETASKVVTLLDAPGHKDFIPNMITGAAQADVAVLVVDATRGEFETGFEAGGQTREHALLVRSLGVSQIAVAINKLDTVKWAEDRYLEIVKTLTYFLVKQAGFKDEDVTCIPCSGLTGENLTNPPDEKALKDWYSGPTLLQQIDQFRSPDRPVTKPFRLCVSDVFKSQGSSFSVVGKVETGFVQAGDKVMVMPIGEQAVVKNITVDDITQASAFAGDQVIISLSGNDIPNVTIGSVVCDFLRPIRVSNRFQARIVVFNVEIPLTKGFQAILHYQSLCEPVILKKIVSQLHKSTGEAMKKKPRCLTKQNNAIVELQASRQICMEEYKDIRELGRFMLRSGGSSVAAGVITQVL